MADAGLQVGADDVAAEDHDTTGLAVLRRVGEADHAAAEVREVQRRAARQRATLRVG